MYTHTQCITDLDIHINAHNTVTGTLANLLQTSYAILPSVCSGLRHVECKAQNGLSLRLKGPKG